jgi:hypothetical protein
MNWRFGFQLGTTEFDGIIYGSASAAADCLKALVPFFIFAAVRNKMWSQAIASGIVWLVVTAYSLTSALGHAALNRQDTAGQRAAQAATYATLSADLERAQQQLSWVPQHRPAATVQGELSGMEARKPFRWSDGCTTVKGRITRQFCNEYAGLKAELGSALQADKLEARISETQTKLAALNGAGPKVADPQAQILAKLTSAFLPGISVEDVQTGLAVFIALLLEVGSGLGMYIAFSQWRIGERKPAPIIQPAAVAETVPSLPVQVAQPALEAPAPVVAPQAPETANDNKTEEKVDDGVENFTVPESDVERFRRENVVAEEGASLTATELYEDYCAWCDEQSKEPLALPTFGREFADLGVNKAKIAGRVRYIGVSLKSSKSVGGKNSAPRDVKAA